MFATILYEILKEPEPPTYVFGKGAYPTLQDAETLQLRQRIRELENERSQVSRSIVDRRSARVDEVRTLNDVEQQTFIQTLRTAAASAVSIVGVGSIPEPHTVAQQLSDSFTAAGWTVSRSMIGESTHFVVGVGAVNTATAFSSRGICVEAADVDDVPSKAVRQAFANVKRNIALLQSKCPSCSCAGPSQELKPHEVRIVVGPR